jgi:hypothetical protein
MFLSDAKRSERQTSLRMALEHQDCVVRHNAASAIGMLERTNSNALAPPPAEGGRLSMMAIWSPTGNNYGTDGQTAEADRSIDGSLGCRLWAKKPREIRGMIWGLCRPIFWYLRHILEPA